MKHFNTIEKSQLYYGDNLEVMDDLPAYSIDLIVTDPPYNFTKANCTKMYKETSKKLMSTMMTIRKSAVSRLALTGRISTDG